MPWESFKVTGAPPVRDASSPLGDATLSWEDKHSAFFCHLELSPFRNSLFPFSFLYQILKHVRTQPLWRPLDEETKPSSGKLTAEARRDRQHDCQTRPHVLTKASSKPQRSSSMIKVVLFQSKPTVFTKDQLLCKKHKKLEFRNRTLNREMRKPDLSPSCAVSRPLLASSHSAPRH